MPLYDYKCETCGGFEQWLRLADLDQPIHCPQCDTQARRVFSPPMILSSGSLGRNAVQTSEPRLVQKRDRGSAPPSSHPVAGRPWMISH